MLMSRLFVMVMVASACAAVRADDSFTVPRNAASVLHQRCNDCHGKDTSEGNVRFDTLRKLNKVDRLELLNKSQEQLYFGLMPPEDAEQPSDAEREWLLGWFSGELNKFGVSKLEEKLQKPEYGNYVDHEKLFSREYAHLKGFTRDRRWLISEFVFDAKVNQLIDHPGVRTIDGVKTHVIGDKRTSPSLRLYQKVKRQLAEDV